MGGRQLKSVQRRALQAMFFSGIGGAGGGFPAGVLWRVVVAMKCIGAISVICIGRVEPTRNLMFPANFLAHVIPSQLRISQPMCRCAVTLKQNLALSAPLCSPNFNMYHPPPKPLFALPSPPFKSPQVPFAFLPICSFAVFVNSSAPCRFPPIPDPDPVIAPSPAVAFHAISNPIRLGYLLVRPAVWSFSQHPKRITLPSSTTAEESNDTHVKSK